MFDFHIHLARIPHKKQLTSLLLDGNYDFIAIACEPWEWKDTVLLKKELSTGIKPFKTSFGIHPMIATQVTDDMFAQMRYCLEDNDNAMVGEAGIDKRFPGYDDGIQDRIFIAQAKLALTLKRDLQIHCVGDYMRILRLLAEAGFRETAPLQLPKTLELEDFLQKKPRPIFHRFGGDANFVKKALPYGSLFSLHNDSFRKKSTAKAIPLIPQERIFFETDADESFCDTDRKYPATGNDHATSMPTPECIVAKLKKSLDSVRIAYAKCRE